MAGLAQSLQRLIGPVAVWRIFSLRISEAPAATASLALAVQPITTSEIATLPDPLLAEQAWYGGQHAHGFAARGPEGDVVGLCFYWRSDRYTLHDFWPLRPVDAMLMQIVTTPAARGRGVARALIQQSTHAVANIGLETLWARVWITNSPSTKAFRAAGWQEVAWVVEINPLRRQRPWRISVRR